MRPIWLKYSSSLSNHANRHTHYLLLRISNPTDSYVRTVTEACIRCLDWRTLTKVKLTSNLYLRASYGPLLEVEMLIIVGTRDGESIVRINKSAEKPIGGEGERVGIRLLERMLVSNSRFPDVIAYKHILALLITYFNGRANVLIEWIDTCTRSD